MSERQAKRELLFGGKDGSLGRGECHSARKPVSEESQRSSPDGEDEAALPDDLGGRRTADLLRAAYSFLRGQVDSDPTESWTPARWRKACTEQTALLRDWAYENNLWIEASHLGRIETGRMEHDLLPDRDPDVRMWKTTKLVGYGRQPAFDAQLVSGMVSDWFPSYPGTPLEYLNRLHCSNFYLYPELNRLEGFSEFGGLFRIITSQPFFKGRNAITSEVDSFFSKADFTKLCHGVYFQADENLAVFDAGSTNLIIANEGVIPIDVIPILAEGAFLAKLQEAYEKVTH